MTRMLLSTGAGPKLSLQLINVGSQVSDRRESVLVGSSTTLAIATVFIAARLVSRVLIVRRTAWDDYFIIAAWFIACGLTASAVVGTFNGLGLHDANIKEQWVYPLRKSEYAFSVLYNPALMATKSSMIIFYLRLSLNTHEWLRAASWITLAVINVAGVVLTFFNIFQCIPVSQVFSPVGKCIPLIELYLASVPVNVITDLACLVLPIPVLTGIQLPRKQKTILIATFGLGLYVIATDIVRIYYLQQSSAGYWGETGTTSSPLLGAEKDFAWYASLSFMWTAIEVNVGLICACIPTLKPLISRLAPQLIDNKRWSSCFWASKNSASSTTVVASPRPGRLSGRMDNMASPISRPPAIFSNTNSNTLVSSGTQAQFSATDTIRSLPATTGEGGDAEMEMLSFITLPGMDPETLPRISTTNTRTQADVYFGFLSIRRPRSMLRTSVKDSMKYFVMIGTLFFLCGFSHGLWNNLNNQIAKVNKNSMARTLGLYSVYYGAYFFGPPTVGHWVLSKHGGFKGALITGLCIYGTGVFMFWPSAVLLSFPGFMISSFFVGYGLSILDMSTDSFVTLCGPAYYGEIRLLMSRTVEGSGKVVGMVLANKGLFQSVEAGPALLHIQWIYLGVSLCCTLLALIIYYLPLPEATDEELEQTRDPGLSLNHTITLPQEQRFRIGNVRVVSLTLALGFCAQFLSAGVQLGQGAYFIPTINSVPVRGGHRMTAFDYWLTADGVGACSRLLFAALAFAIPPRILLMIAFLGATLFCALIHGLNGLHQDSLAGLMIASYFFVGPMWPLIFAISLRGMGRRTKKAVCILTCAQGSAAIVPWLMFAIVQDGRKAKYTYCLLVAFLGLGILFPVYLSAFSSARKQVHRGDKDADLVIFENREWPRERRGSQQNHNHNGVLGSRLASVLPTVRENSIEMGNRTA